jgi:multiple sugar transport system permease protein
MGKRARREEREGYLFISPWIIGFLVFTAGPMLASLILSLARWDVFSPPQFVGLANFRRMFSVDPYYWQSVKVTLVYTVFSVPLVVGLGLGVALMLNTKLRGAYLFRTIFYLPSVISGVAVAVAWTWVFSADFGILNYLLGLVGIEGPNWLTSTTWALPALVIMSVWSIGPVMMALLAGLQSISPVFYESAALDGAGRWTSFWRITLPMLSPSLLFTLVVTLVNSFKVFTPAYVMTGGGPLRATLFYVLHLYREAFVNYNMGYGSAMACMLFVIVAAITTLVLKSSGRWVYYEGEGAK